jgi:outer membrane lipoprotein SlyB
MDQGDRPVEPVDEEEPGMLFGRPVEERSFETVELAVGAAIGFSAGAALGGLAGAVIGGLLGAAVGAGAAERLEHAVGAVGLTTDTSRHHARV